MAYASLPDVQALESARVYTATSQPATAQVALFLDNRAAEIDAILTDKGYVLPVPYTASSALLYLRNLNSMGAWMDVQTSAPAAQMRTQAAAMWSSALEMLKLANTILDIPKDEERASPRGPGLTVPARTVDQPYDPVFYPHMDTAGNPRDPGWPLFTRSQQF